MSDRFAVDTNAVVDMVRVARVTPPLLQRPFASVFMPLPVAGELITGAYSTPANERNLATTETVIARWPTLIPDMDTARLYGRIRAQARLLHQLGQARTNDLWIAALCIQHSLPLLTNDRGFNGIENLEVIHW